MASLYEGSWLKQCGTSSKLNAVFVGGLKGDVA